MTEVTPLRQQYLDIKQKYRDCIVMFRLGDFYEMFDEDAETAARELDLVLTGRNASKSERVPMAGVPYHAVEGYIARLIEKGYHVAVCEQITEPNGRGLVEREVTRVITPGTIIEPELLVRRQAQLSDGDLSPRRSRVRQLDDRRTRLCRHHDGRIRRHPA